MLDRLSRRALYRQLGDTLRSKITTGELEPGSRLPSEAELARTYEVSRDVVRDALAVVRAEGLVVKRRGRPSMIRDRPSMDVVRVSEDAGVTARMPTPQECGRLSLAEGVPVLVVRVGHDEKLYPANCTEVRYSS